jgi:hypothetical protein
MHEKWLQKYIKDHYLQIGFTQIHGPYSLGADFKGVYADRPVKIEAEWNYADFITHKHPPGFADVLVVATLEPVPPALEEILPSIIINLDREEVIKWAQPLLIKKTREDYYAYPWRRFSKSLLEMYACYRKQEQRGMAFIGSDLAISSNKNQTPAGFQFASGGKEESFEGRPEDKSTWDYWLIIAHSVADHFKLKPALLRLTWIDRVALYFKNTGRITDGERKRFNDVAVFIDDLLQPRDR